MPACNLAVQSKRDNLD